MFSILRGRLPAKPLRSVQSPPRAPALPALSPDPELLVATVDAEGAFVRRNKAWMQALGDGAEAWGRLSPEDQSLALQSVAEAASGSLVTNQVFTLAVSHRDEPAPLLLHFLPVPAEARPGAPPAERGAVMIAGEVLAEPTTWTSSQTQRHRMESLGRMTMGIAHDFNNLLSSILGYTEIMRSSLAEAEGPAALAEHLQTVEQAALDGAALIRKIQQYIRQEKQTHFEPLSVSTLIADCAALTRPYWHNEPRRKGISIDMRLDLAETPPIAGSAAELREVFVNLILNAVQAMPEGGAITWTTAYDAARGAVVVRLQDTGLGIPEHVQPHIFEPLFTTKGDQGTGMGLAVSYGIIQEHDGRIAVESAPGKGARFEMAFPAAGPAPAAAPPPEAAPERRACRILIVDDDRLVRDVLRRLLAMKGHQVAVAAGGDEALAHEALAEADIVFSDLGMPGMNGRQLAERIRRRYPDKPIILLTGDTLTGEPDAFVDLVLPKPFQLDQLERSIQELLRR